MDFRLLMLVTFYSEQSSLQCFRLWGTFLYKNLSLNKLKRARSYARGTVSVRLWLLLWILLLMGFRLVFAPSLPPPGSYCNVRPKKDSFRLRDPTESLQFLTHLFGEQNETIFLELPLHLLYTVQYITRSFIVLVFTEINLRHAVFAVESSKAGPWSI